MSRLIELFQRSIRVLRMQSLLRRVSRLQDRQLKLLERFEKLVDEVQHEQTD